MNYRRKAAVLASITATLLLTSCNMFTSTNDTTDSTEHYKDNEYNSKTENMNLDIYKESGNDLIEEDVQAAENSDMGINSETNYITIGEASTRLIDRSPNRMSNINLAIKSLENIVIESGQEFSFNTVVGERSMERGYKEAAAILYEKQVSEIGGGVCQISSTIYQAAKKAGLEIIERNQHNKEVNYVEKGMDACVEYGRLDFRFRNNTDKNIILKTSCDGEYVYASIET